MEVQVFLFAKWDSEPMTEFPHILSDWSDDGPASYVRGRGTLEQHVFTGTKQTRTITTEGLQSPVHGFSRAVAPKYPAHQLTGYNADHSIVAAVDAHSDLIVYALSTIDPDDYDSLPAAMKDMRPDDPIKEEVWTPLEAGLIAVTPVGDQRDQVTTALGNWRTAHPLGTAREFAIVIRNFTS